MMINLREKIIAYGVSTLKNEELLAVIIGSGTKKFPVSDLAKTIICNSESLNLSLEQLMSFNGIGVAQACKILAAIELGTRKIQSDTLSEKVVSVDDIGRHLINKIGSAPQEKLIAIYLNNSYHIIDERVIFIGTVDQATVHPRDILREAIKISATQIVIAHNHPNGSLMFSKNDQEFTLRLKKCCHLIGINLLDHLIITKKTYSRMKSLNLI
ncbi:DNA repair protein RadC [Lactobacillus halodurans]|uniref:DNA repair protein RadC n=1 Tax=Companilactobacillus halodurans TaxID=2584183 RepID=A0A5P0ZL67_9LACO|nr:DNA repair protein RadC [Companilactobacillus halodurans]MQS74963.1 DNA repair protein RadC [Companilactobacillus halodurans]